MDKKPGTGGLPRRDFLRGSMAMIAGVHVPLPCAAASASQAEPEADPMDPRESLGRRDRFLAPHARFQELQFGRVRPQGWLKRELQKQAENLTLPQSDFCFPFDRRYWASNERGQDQESRNGGTFWYPWEQMGYWTDGAYRCAKLTGNAHLQRRAMEPISYTLQNPVDGWYLGPHKLHDLPVNQDPSRWPQAVFFRAMAAAAEGENSTEILNAMSHHYLQDNQCDYQHGPFGPRDQVNLESILWCYAHSGDQRLLEKAENIWSGIPVDEVDELTADQPSKMHGVTFAERSRLGALMFTYTGDARQLDTSVAAMQRVFKYHMLPDGTPSTTEGLKGTTSLDGHETCDIVEFNLAWGSLLMATGNGQYADRIERALFNAGMGAVRKDWTGVQYISCPNQLHIARNSCQVGHVGTAAALYGPNSDHRPKYKFITACCAGNINRMLPTYAQRTWMRTAGAGLAAVLYAPCSVSARAGENLQPVEILEESAYPFSDQIHFQFRSASPVKFPLHLRIPSWCETPRLSINDRHQALPPLQGGFAVLDRVHTPGDVITLELPMNTRIGHSSDGGVYIERGPLTYSLQPKEQWTPIEMPEFEITSADYFPMWAASAASPWNYALDLNDSDLLAAKVRVHSRTAGSDPWADPPVTLEVPVRKVQEWNLVHAKGADAKWFMTPPIPEAPVLSESPERISLVPLGCTQLRLTVFPWAGRKNSAHQDDASADSGCLVSTGSETS